MTANHAMNLDANLLAPKTGQASIGSIFEQSSKKIAWKLFREFVGLDSLKSRFSGEGCLWQIENQSGSVEERAVKLLLRQRDTHQICETVVLFSKNERSVPAQGSRRQKRMPRATACISSQPGCGVGCPFCATGELGYRGNFTGVEIAEQVYWAGRVAMQQGFRLRNVVFMGMGEPLHNPIHLFHSLDLLTRVDLFGLAPRHLTVSTVGVPRAMVSLAEYLPDVRIALSLHAADPELRRQLVPRAVGDLDVLRSAIRRINGIQTQPVWLEVVMLAGLNDQPRHAAAIVDFCDGLNVEVNLIPYNAAAGNGRFLPSNRERRDQFADSVRQAGIRTTIRTSFGTEQQAGCGQLAAHKLDLEQTECS